MKQKNFLSVFLGFWGVFFIVFTVVLSFRSIHEPARILSVSEEAKQLTEVFLESLNSGDYAQAGTMVLGQPELEPEEGQQSELGQILWEAYHDSLSCEFDGGIYISDASYYRDMNVRFLDIPGVMAQLKQQIQPALELRAENMERELVCDDQGAYREDFVMDTVCLLAKDLLTDNPEYVTRKVTLALVYQDDQWWVRMDQSLMRILSGGL